MLSECLPQCCFYTHKNTVNNLLPSDKHLLSDTNTHTNIIHLTLNITI